MINPFRRRAELAQQQADVIRQNPALADVPLDDLARAAEAARLAQLAERTAKVRAAQARADEETRRADALDAAVAAHAAAEQSEAKRLRDADKHLTTARAGLAAASVAADKALRVLFDAAQAYDGLVAQTAGELRAAGLPATYQDRDQVVEFDNGGTTAGEVILRGAWWIRLSPAEAVSRALYGHRRAVYGIAAVQGQDAGIAHLERTGLFADAPLPAPFVAQLDPQEQELRRVRREQHAAMGAEVILSDHQRENIRRDAELAAQNAKHRREQGMHEYARNRAALVARVGEDKVRAAERDLFLDGEAYGLTPEAWAQHPAAAQSR